ncbi:MAG: adenylate/guanylate cyclase domain-containing protein [Anaerolineales bacterium]
MGAAVNLAARLESAAPPGGVIISQQTYQHVRGIFELNPVEPITAKGFSEPIQAYQVFKAKPHAFRLKTRGIEGVETPMVGRKLELNSLQNDAKVVIQEEEGRFVTVVGEAGVGKSRNMTRTGCEGL